MAPHQRSTARSPSSAGYATTSVVGSSACSTHNNNIAPPRSANSVDVVSYSASGHYHYDLPACAARRRARGPPTTTTTPAPAAATRPLSSSCGEEAQRLLPTWVAVLLWYVLGVVSIATSKVLLSGDSDDDENGGRGHGHDGVNPLALTAQQLFIGMTASRILLELRGGLRPVPTQQSFGSDAKKEKEEKGSPEHRRCVESGTIFKRNSSEDDADAAIGPRGGDEDPSLISAMLAWILPPSATATSRDGNGGVLHAQLLLAASYFAVGFLFTNVAFRGADASFVETIKASEPFASASVAVLWGLERLDAGEVASLAGIVGGVALSALGGERRPSNGDVMRGGGGGSQSSLARSCLVVAAANLCFSFRGLHQKLFRASPGGRSTRVDDLNLQYRMQQIGLGLLVIPALLSVSFTSESSRGGPLTIAGRRSIAHHVVLSLVNGLAFASYNLASTHVLTRLSVVHHAALNCVRRIFAVAVTSILFGARMTTLQVVGIAGAAGCFFRYVRCKARKEERERRRRELRGRWGV